ncbi:MAG: hypothetical protein EZS28_028648, partial [Streblomastix strix]
GQLLNKQPPNYPPPGNRPVVVHDAVNEILSPQTINYEQYVCAAPQSTNSAALLVPVISAPNDHTYKTPQSPRLVTISST